MPLIGRPMMRRPLLRGAMVAGAGYAAGRSGANRRAQDADQEERLASLESQSYAAPAASASESDISVKADELKKLKELLDGGILTQEEFDAQKHQILNA